MKTTNKQPPIYINNKNKFTTFINKSIISLCSIITVLFTAIFLTGCGGKADNGEKVFYYGDTTFNSENDESDVNPHNGYSGWACIRYGIGETLFKYSDTMELEPWLATEYDNVDETTWKVTLRDDVTFISGRKLDALAVKECLEHLISVHKRAAGDLNIADIEADGSELTIKTTKPVPALMNYLSDPYGCIIDMQTGITPDGNVSATGPYKAVSVKTDSGITLVKNDNYWDGEPKLDKIVVETISDGDTLTMALQSGELDAAYGLPYASHSLFTEDKDYTISSCETSRSFFAQMNYATESLKDANVRKAIACAINKEEFTRVLLNGNGTAAKGPFPVGYAYGDSRVSTEEYNVAKAKELLAASGWIDTDGDGYVEKDGKRLTLSWLTYPSRQELPLLAENVQAALKDIGIEIKINCTANHLDYIKKGDWDIYASAFVCAPTGDAEYFFTTHCLKDSSKNRGGYYNEKLEELEKTMSETFDEDERAAIAVKMTQTILDDNAFVFASHLKMSIVSGKGVTGLVAHPSDYYEITADLDKN